jgi:peptide/nickel transport system ATP-binding protein
MYGGEVVERGPSRDVYGRPRHPYSAALIDAVPRIDETTAVVGIPGLPPAHVVEGACAYSGRCRFARQSCRSIAPGLTPIGGLAGNGKAVREVRCLRAAELGEIAPQLVPHERRRVRADAPLLRIENAVLSYAAGQRRRRSPVVKDLSLELLAGETLAIVGESGSGKSTLLRAIAGLHRPDAGVVLFDGTPLPDRAVDRPRALRRAIQLVFQDPHASLNPRHTVRTIIERPLRLFQPDLDGTRRRARIRQLLADVRLDANVADRFPHELSGGQKQRVALARAFAADPRLLLCDEVVSALDVSVQASILELLEDLVNQHDVSVLFVSHDLAVVRQIADRVCVMRRGEICETGVTERLFAQPKHEYTRSLLAAVPRPQAA